ncbi:nucleoplasmin-like protein isoform X2 [Euwallacea fornicatus]|uniref:nucleoplasmin-like protein isoform X2 n=1 Tax=Euwallacea fornicatus TaxID=995702 RepID=UPI00338FC9B1
MADEYFFALTLKGKNTNEVWDPEAKGAGAEDYQGGHKLIIKQALLGAEATEGEVNVIQVEAMTWKDSVKIPIATLKAGGPNNQVLLDLSFPDPPVTFTLIQGNGPVHIIGHHLIGGPIEEFDEMDEMEEEMIEDEEGEEGAEEEEDDEEPKSKKAKTNNVNKGKTPVKNNAKPKK